MEKLKHLAGRVPLPVVSILLMGATYFVSQAQEKQKIQKAVEEWFDEHSEALS